MQGSWYDTAVICALGHVLNAAAISYPESTTAFCDRCGSPALSCCPCCGVSIRGEYHLAGTLAITPYVTPAYCPACGAAYPWTEARLLAAAELADGMEQLTREERELLKVSIWVVACQGPTTAVAVVRLKRLLAKVGTAAAESFRQILVDVVSEAMRKAVWGPSA